MTWVAGIRVIETSMDDASSTFVIQGELEFGTVNAGMQVSLPLPGGERMTVPIHSVEVVQDSFGMNRLAVGIVIADAETRKTLRALRLAGRDLQILRTDGASTSGMSFIVKTFFGMCAVLGLLILGAAFFLPVMLHRNAVTVQGTAWEVATVGVFIGAFALIRKGMGWSLLVLAFACAFFFVSCASNIEYMY